MSLESYGVHVDVVEVDAAGCLNIGLTTDREVRVTLNGRYLKPEGSALASRFWQADGTQTDTPPIDLRGEER